MSDQENTTPEENEADGEQSQIIIPKGIVYT